MKTKEEQIKDDELKKVTGGVGGSGGNYFPSSPSTIPNPSTPTETYTIPIKGDDTEHKDIG